MSLAFIVHKHSKMSLKLQQEFYFYISSFVMDQKLQEVMNIYDIIDIEYDDIAGYDILLHNRTPICYLTPGLYESTTETQYNFLRECFIEAYAEELI